MFELKPPTRCAIRLTAENWYLAPHPALRSVIAHYTVMPPHRPIVRLLTLIPDASGCIVCSLSENGISADLWGPTTKTCEVSHNGDTNLLLVFVEFMPGGLYRLTNLPTDELTDKILPLESALPVLNRDMVELLAQTQSADTLAARLDALFLRRLTDIRVTDSALALTGLISGLRPHNSVREIAQALCYSERHLNRLFHATHGMSAKTYLKLLRVNHLMLILRKPASLPLSTLAQEAGYYDESHLIHDFKGVCGVSPGVFLANASVFYNEPLKF